MDQFYFSKVDQNSIGIDIVALMGMVGFHLWETARTIHTETPPVRGCRKRGIYNKNNLIFSLKSKY
ncbi:hypothetical protein CBG25_12725 [Arsenophonus sp. ENCA]|nr:hypothetical protein CBG25_12725 [Arsenophonus sp. ENCA]